MRVEQAVIASQGGPSSRLHLAARAAKWRGVRTSGTPSREGVVSIIRNGFLEGVCDDNGGTTQHDENCARAGVARL